MTHEGSQADQVDGQPPIEQKTEQEETWHCSRLDCAAEILSALLPRSKRALRRSRRILGCCAFFGMLAPD